MPETLKPDLTYVCPHCGQSAVVGSHFCQTVTAPSPKAPPSRARTRWMTAGIVAFLMAAVLWRWLGPASLFPAALGFLVIASWKKGKGA